MLDVETRPVMSTVTLERINAMTPQAFVGALGGVFEHSPWIAESAFVARPFANVTELHEAMINAVMRAARERQLALLNAHPELAGKEARARALTSSSAAEQASVGLNALSREEIQLLARWNREYREKFGFPFIIAVRRHTKASIFREIERRLANDTETELNDCLEQVFLITRLRLEALLAAQPGSAT
jgi:2-oxo-4-hydroxy-4-carboxy-5-ureidoimidazoline decarboxylase